MEDEKCPGGMPGRNFISFYKSVSAKKHIFGNIQNTQIANFTIRNLCYHYPGGDIMSEKESVIQELTAMEHRLVEMSGLECFRESRRAKWALMMAENIKMLKRAVEAGIE